MGLINARQNEASSTRFPRMAHCCTGQWPASGVSAMPDGHAEATNRAPLSPLGLQPCRGDITL